MYNEFVKNITKESDPVRQKHYTTKKHWLVDFINIFWLILKLFLFRQQILCFCCYYPYWHWNRRIPFGFCMSTSNWNWQPPWSGRSCRNLAAKNTSSFFVTAGIRNRTWCPSLTNIQTWIWSVTQGLILSCMILHLHVPVGGDVRLNMGDVFLLRQILRFPMKRSVITIPVSPGSH